MERERALSEHTIRARAGIWRRLEAGTGKRMDDLGRRDIERWIERNGAAWARTTLATNLAHIRAYYALAGLPDPTRDINRPRVARRLPRPLSDADRDRVLSAYTTGDLAVMLRLMARLGLRRGEVARLRPADLWTGADGRQLLLVHGKGSKERVIPVPGWMSTLLEGYSWPTHSPERVTRIIGDAMRLAGVEGTPHQLRHTAASDAYRISQDPIAVQRLMGHASLATTQLYAEPARHAMLDALERMSA